MKPIKATLLYLIKEDEILLVYKKRGHGEGKWNGIGGKIDGETPEECVIREAAEETSLRVSKFELCGIIYFYNVYGRDWDVFVFRGYEFEGTPVESEEVYPRWFKFSEIPYDEMWEDDREWLPSVIDGRYFIGEFHFNGVKLVRSEVKNLSKAEIQIIYSKLRKEE